LIFPNRSDELPQQRRRFGDLCCRSAQKMRGEEQAMLRTIAAFDRIGEENAFAVLARANALAG